MVVSARTDFKRLLTSSVKKTHNTNSHHKAEGGIKTNSLHNPVKDNTHLLNHGKVTSYGSLFFQPQKVIYNTSKTRGRFKAKFSPAFPERSN